MLMFWVDESAQVTADEDAAMMIAVKSWGEQMTERGVRLYGGPLMGWLRHHDRYEGQVQALWWVPELVRA